MLQPWPSEESKWPGSLKSEANLQLLGHQAVGHSVDPQPQLAVQIYGDRPDRTVTNYEIADPGVVAGKFIPIILPE